ncbi:Asp-tRNA(Asn)/Glu-tRNA(Gln) amidotransferase GatCAB subunit B, partial [Candidatus Berkelbacteria bacterium CG23_combo_of_CG06-09_8_20_14_all_41_73]
RGFDSEKGITFEQRRKEEAADYRYFPEPDIPPISFSASEIAKIKNQIVELPKTKKARYISLGIREDVAERIVRHPHIAEYLESAEELKKELAVFVSEEVNKAIADHKISYEEYKKKVPVTSLADLLNLVGEGIISKTMAKEVFAEMVRSGKKATDIIKEKGLEQVSESGELGSVIANVIRENPELVEKYHAGKTQVLGFFVGEVMKKTGGKANPQILNKLLKERLNGYDS